MNKAFIKLQESLEHELLDEVKVWILNTYFELTNPGSRFYIDTEDDIDVDKSGIIHRIGAKQFKECPRWQVDIEGDGICDVNPAYDFYRFSNEITAKFIECNDKFQNDEFPLLKQLYKEYMDSDHTGHELMFACTSTSSYIEKALIDRISNRNFDSTEEAKRLLQNIIEGSDPQSYVEVFIASVDEMVDMVNDQNKKKVSSNNVSHSRVCQD
jgi:hypothetical protein